MGHLRTAFFFSCQNGARLTALGLVNGFRETYSYINYETRHQD